LKFLSKFKQKIENKQAKLSKNPSSDDPPVKKSSELFKNLIKPENSLEGQKLIQEMKEILFGNRKKDAISESKIARNLENVNINQEKTTPVENKETVSHKELINSLKSMFKNPEFQMKEK